MYPTLRTSGSVAAIQASANFAKVFGRHPFLWLLPTNQGIEGNGIFFELNLSEEDRDASSTTGTAAAAIKW